MFNDAAYEVPQRDRLGGVAETAAAALWARNRLPDDVGDQYPPGLFAEPFAPTTDTSSGDVWWLAHTRPRQEKAVAGALAARQVSYYLPLITRKSLTRGRTRVARVPLFAGYVFIRGSDEDRLEALRTNRVLTVYSVPDCEQLHCELRQFAQLIARDAPLVPEARLLAGDRVRVKAGPFRDSEGVVIRRCGKTRLLIAANCLQQGASLEIDDFLLEPV